MNVYERAWQVWPLLAFAARNRQTLTYEIVAQLTGMATPGLGKVLEPIQSYCLLNRLPPLSALVVNKETGLPGVGFIAVEDVPRELIRIFEHNWVARPCPTPDSLEDAVRQLPSNGIPVRGSGDNSTRERAPTDPSSRNDARKYQPLREYLAARQHQPHVRLTFAEIAAIIGDPLPHSAFKYREWWSNQSDTSNRPQAAAWMQAGFAVQSVNQDPSNGSVEFVRK